MAGRSAAGQAAGYHFQVQRGLLSLVAGDDGTSVAIETLDDLVVANDSGAVRDLEQLKHSIRSGSLTERSRPLWKALDVWMDLAGHGTLNDVGKLILVATDRAPDSSAVALLRPDDDRDVASAEQQLLVIAAEDPGAQDTAKIRARFRAMDPRARGRLVAKIEVRDATAGIGDFREQLREALGRFALPAAGTEEFLDKLVGWWERRAVDLLLRRRSAVTREEVVEEVVRLRDQYSERTLPAPDPTLAVELSEVLFEAYAGTPFVRQLELIAMRDERVQLAVRDYHRAYAQRSRWLEQGVLAPNELEEWEDRLFDEWEHAWQRMLDNLPDAADEPTQAITGKQLYGDMEQSSLNPLRDGRDRFLHVGTLNGIADICRIGWHPDFKVRLQQLVNTVVVGAGTDDAFRRAQGAG
jgi:ABC-3C protein